MKRKVEYSKINIVILLFLIIVFGIFFLAFDVKEYSDSFQYLNMFPTRDPIYCLFLRGCKELFGETYYFKAIGFIQNALAIISIYCLNETISKHLRFNKLYKVLVAIILTVPHIITPLFSATGLILTNAILTEGISISLFYIWMIFIINLIYEDRKGNDISALICAVVLSLVRGQLLVCLVAWFVAIVIKLIVKKRWKWIFGVCISLVVIVIGRTELVKSYNNYFWNMPVSTFSGKAMMVANALYVAEPGDGDKINTPYLREIFDLIITRMDEDNICMSDAEKRVLGKALLHDDVHDRINFDYYQPVVREYLKTAENLDETNYLYLMYRVNEIAGELMAELIPIVVERYFTSYVDIVSLGLIRSVAVEMDLLIPYVIVVYLLAIGASVYIILKKSERSGAQKAAMFMLFVVMMIFGNAMATGLMLQCISRYMIYNFPFFYIALLGVLREVRHSRTDILTEGINP